MGLFSRTKARLKHSGTKSDTPCDDERTLEEQLIDAQAHLARVKLLPPSSWTPHIANGQFITYSVDAKDNAIAVAKADVAELRARIRLSQQDTPKTVSQDKRGKNA